MRISNIVPLVSRLAEGQFMGGWINALSSSNDNNLEFEYFTSWISSDSGFERGCSQEDIDLHHQSQGQFNSLRNFARFVWFFGNFQLI